MSTDAGNHILLVVQQPGNARVLAQAVQEAGMHPVHVDRRAGLDAELDAPEPATAALVDLAGFGGDVWDLCARLQGSGIPFVVVSPARDRGAGDRSLQYGASSVVEKPVAKDALMRLLHNLSAR